MGRIGIIAVSAGVGVFVIATVLSFFMSTGYILTSVMLIGLVANLAGGTLIMMDTGDDIPRRPKVKTPKAKREKAAKKEKPAKKKKKKKGEPEPAAEPVASEEGFGAAAPAGDLAALPPLEGGLGDLGAGDPFDFDFDEEK